MAKVFNLGEVKKHVTEDDCWIIVHGKVYDVTKFLDEHPGGFDIIITNTGTLCNRQCVFIRVSVKAPPVGFTCFKALLSSI